MESELTDAIVGMREDEAIGLVRSMLDAGVDPADVLTEAKEAMTALGDLKKFKEVCGDVLCFWGNVPNSLLVTGTPQQVKDDVKELVDLFAGDRAHPRRPRRVSQIRPDRRTSKRWRKRSRSSGFCEPQVIRRAAGSSGRAERRTAPVHPFASLTLDRDSPQLYILCAHRASA